MTMSNGDGHQEYREFLARKSQLTLFSEGEPSVNGLKRYRPVLTAVENMKGVLDVDTVKGCTFGMRANPLDGCYSECYAYKNAHRYGIDFSVSIARKLLPANRESIFCAVADHPASWYRIGTAGDPCHDWDNTLSICEALRGTGKTPVIITKHWIPLSDAHIVQLNALGATVNTSTSGLDSSSQIEYRVAQIKRLKANGVSSITRVVTCQYGTSEWATIAKEKQDYLMTLAPVIDNPLRADKSNLHVLSGDILLTRKPEAIGGGKFVSLHAPSVYLGTCGDCPDQCGADTSLRPKMRRNEVKKAEEQMLLYVDKVEYICVKSIIGSGYEADIAKLAIEDKIAMRAARKNMQIHSAVILKIDGKFSGFMTFQKNHEVREFCLLQSVIEPKSYTKELYRELVEHVIAENTEVYPAIITTDPKSKFETPALFESLGFKTYLQMSGFHYMVRGNLADIRMKLLAHITMTNVWQTTKGDWLRLKREWNDSINAAGEAKGITNPTYATRDGCWQGENGYSNVVNTRRSLNEKGEIVVTTKAHNGNASVLDPLACEVIARFFMPQSGGKVYNPFGGGVQFGFVAGACGYEYLASEIRQNQVDANNAIVSQFDGRVKWVQEDSAVYDPGEGIDLVFTCPPYYKVEEYLDYNGEPPPGEINSCPTYEEFRDLLFSGYKKAIARLKDNRFFVVMTGDSRDKNGAYYCSEAETEMFLKSQGLSIYNRIVYLECEFTRLAHAKKTLNTRKFPKREQKIIVAYKGNISSIKEVYAPIGRL